MAALSLIVLIAATRLPLFERSLGEADAARYLVGLVQWERIGRAAPFIYAKVLSPGYYAAAAAVTASDPQRWLDLVSLLAALATAPVALALGLRLASRTVAIAGAALFLVSPAMWWLGIEAHPQGPSFLLLLLAVLAYTRAARGGEIPAAALLGLGMLVKSDLILFAGVFPTLRTRLDGGWSWRRLAAGLSVPAGALALFFAGRPMLLGMNWRAAQVQTNHALLEFLALPLGTAWLKQLLPGVLAPGVATTALVALGLAAGARQAAWRRQWLPLVAAWTAPGTVFWLLLRGNNARHMAPFLLIPLWAALDAMETRVRGTARLAWMCMAAAGLNLVLIPPSSNLTLYPSGNVAASARDLAARLGEARSRVLAAVGSGSTPCFVGDYSLPYLEWTLLEAAPGATLRVGPAGAVLAGSAGPKARFIEIGSGTEYRRAARWCEQLPAVAQSLEFGPDGGRRWFLGSELRRLPWLRWGYAALSRNLRH